MGIARFERNRRVRIDDVEHELTRMVGQTLWELENLKTGYLSRVEIRELVQMFEEGKLAFVATELAPRHYLPDLSGAELQIAKLRRLYALAIKDLPNTHVRVREAVAECWMHLKQPQNPPSSSSVMQWKKRLQSAGGDIRALLDNSHRKGNREPRYDNAVITLCHEAIREVYLCAERRTVRATLERAEGKVHQENLLRPDGAKLQMPTLRLVRRLISTYDAMDVCIARFGRDAARNRFRSTTQHRMTEAPLERAEMDHTHLDVIALDDYTFVPVGRPYLTLCVDHFTRCVLGVYIGFQPPSFSSVAKCLEHCFRPKAKLRRDYPEIQNEWPAYGVMRELVVDMGNEFHSESFTTSCHSLGIEIHYAARKEPWFKGTIERLIGTINRSVSHALPGSTFANIMQRGDYDPLKHACITLSTLRKIVMMWISDDYHQNTHRAIGTSPASLWNRSIRPDDIPVPDDSVCLAALVGSVHRRKLTHKGIEFEGLLYNSVELAEHRRIHGEKLDVEIRVDEQDLGQIYVVCPGAARPFTVPALIPEYATGMSLYSHRACKKLAGEREAEGTREALIEARRRLLVAIQEDFALKKKKTRKRSARFLQGTPDRGFTDAKLNSHGSVSGMSDWASSAGPSSPREGISVPTALSTSEEDELLEFAPRWKG